MPPVLDEMTPLPPCAVCNRPRFWRDFIDWMDTVPKYLALYCSPECRRVLRAEHARARRAEAAAARPARDCDRCGQSYIPTRTDARYCSTRCRVAAHRARAAERARLHALAQRWDAS